nr:AraC family transcriptional regulator [Ramlibacter albus]
MYDLIFDSGQLAARVVFVGTRCSRDNLLRNYRTGSIHFVRSGRAEVLTGQGAPIRIEEPSLVFFPLGCPHWVRAMDDEGFDLVCAFTSYGEGFSQAISLSFPEVLVMPLARLDGIRQLLDAFFAEAASQAPGSRQLADRLCEVVLGYIARHALESGRCAAGALAGASDPQIAAALRAIHTRYPTALDIDALAAEAGMSRSRFVERFRAVVGTSPHDYLTHYRIGVAQQLLRRRVPVKTVAGRVGYTSVAAFVRRFKGVVGLPPAAWAG